MTHHKSVPFLKWDTFYFHRFSFKLKFTTIQKLFEKGKQ